MKPKKQIFDYMPNWLLKLLGIKKMVHAGRLTIQKGQKLWVVDVPAKTITQTPITSKIVTKPNHIYIAAINVTNCKKILKRDHNIDTSGIWYVVNK